MVSAVTRGTRQGDYNHELLTVTERSKIELSKAARTATEPDETNQDDFYDKLKKAARDG